MGAQVVRFAPVDQAPKPRLKRLQPAAGYHLAADSTARRCAWFSARPLDHDVRRAHVGRTIVLKMDLRDFFVSITSARVVALFLTAGYPEPVARLLAGLCTNTVPLQVCKKASRREANWPPAGDLAGSAAVSPATPAPGAPTSPALANLAAFRLDTRLAGLARVADAAYTRYADDLVFSGGEAFARSIARFPTHVAATALEEGFAVQHQRLASCAGGQARAAGIVINQKINMIRSDFDQLKAVLYNLPTMAPRARTRGSG